jgi:hypothetical protein
MNSPDNDNSQAVSMPAYPEMKKAVTGVTA